MHSIRFVRLTRVALASILLVLAGCDSDEADSTPSDVAVSEACRTVNVGIPNDMDRQKWAAYASSLADLPTGSDAATRTAFEAVASSAKRYARASPAQREAREARWWQSFEALVKTCKANGSPMRP